MASTPQFHRFFIFLAALQLSHTHKASGFLCWASFSNKTCPELPTYDAFDITTYDGLWFEIGSSANFKNLHDAGGICAVANYTLEQAPSPGKGAVMGVYNTLFSLGAPSHKVSQVSISVGAASICSDGLDICEEVFWSNGTSNPISSLEQGYHIMNDVAMSFIHGNASVLVPLAVDLITMKDHLLTILEGLWALWDAAYNIQTLNSQLGQGQGNTTANVEALLEAGAKLKYSTGDIAGSVTFMEGRRVDVLRIAADLKSQGDLANSSQLEKGAALFLAGEHAILNKVGRIQKTLEGLQAASQAFLDPASGKQGYNSAMIGRAQQNASFAGKMEVTFPGSPSGKYWVLAVDGKTSDGSYAATLIYGCDVNGGGRAEETLVILSRTPTLQQDSVQRLLAKAADLGVTGRSCSYPFIMTVQDPTCGEPPV